MKIQYIYSTVSKYFRIRRMCRFQKSFGLNPESRILDVGGHAFNWQLISMHSHVTFLNLRNMRDSNDKSDWIVGDGRYLPFKDGAFDIVFSNSVIEHLGDFENQKLFAEECRRVGRRYYVQTPDKHFFIEPHFITPFIHWFPRHVQRLLLRNFTVWGCIMRPTDEYCDKIMNEIRLLDVTEMHYLFPDSEIIHEKFLGMSKSLIAVKTV